MSLQGRFDSSNTIGTISLSSWTPPDESLLYVSGYGATSSGGPAAAQLMQVAVSKKNFDRCNSAYGYELTSNMLCAAAFGSDSCQGDSGGPLTYNGQQIGIVSFGNGCANPYFPGVYTYIPAVASWIADNID